MKISSKGLALIKRFEGCRLAAYKDAGGVATIGYGHTRGVAIGQTITQAQADAFLVEDCAGAEAAVNKYMSKYNFNQNQFDALVSFAFNIGNIDKLTVDGIRTIVEISEKIPAYCYCGGQKLQGLVKRREAERELFDTPVSGQACVSAAETTYSKTQFVEDVQSAVGAKVDGIAGKETLEKTVTVSKTKNSRHAVVRPLQRCLNLLGYNCGTADGIAGSKFDTAVKA